MGKKKASTNMKGPTVPAASSGSHLHQASSISLREEMSGKKQSHVNAKSMLKLDHIKDLAIWASGEASIPSLGAFFGHRLASTAEALSVPPDPALFSCQRCESILQPGYNCTVRIEKNKAKVCQRYKKANNLATENSVVYKCHFCSHCNLKRGTPKRYLKEICPPKAKLLSKLDCTSKTIQKSAKPEVTGSKNNTIEMDVIALPEIASDDPANQNSPSTPITRLGTLLDVKRRKRNRSGSKKATESESNSAVMDAEKATNALSKRKRKSWTSLKEIAELSKQDDSRNFSNLKIPFII